jgi:hypothetical protein
VIKNEEREGGEEVKETELMIMERGENIMRDLRITCGVCYLKLI